jgi:tetratricopeptide repeat protein/doubled CXXCH motif protein/cytochrome c554/c'-like protein
MKSHVASALRRKTTPIVVCVAAGLLGLAALAYHRSSTATSAPSFIGSTTCRSCHPRDSQAWQSSQHALAMQVARQGTVLGNFNETQLTYANVTSTFSRRDGKFLVRTDGPNGALQDFELKYTFGVYPLQQYLAELPGGRLQALSIAWDARPTNEGGQRWFHLYPAERITAGDELHWTGRNQNWNFMCADCHSTNVRKGYDPASTSFATTWSEMNVGCEACHGPGSRHASWAGASRWMQRLRWADNGLTNQLTERRGVAWTIDQRSGRPNRTARRTSNREITTCAPCHSRRQQIAEGYRAGAPLEDFYVPALITSGLYHPDGQQRDEVYTHGSFLQSRMEHAGVTCADCHEPHSGKLRSTGNALCGQCHSPQKYDAPIHHYHPAGSAGATCVSCHMPAATYMVIDARRDHSIRVPRPDQTLALGVPNACNGCHADRGAEWASTQVRAWYGRDAAGFQSFADVFHGDDSGRLVEDALVRLAADPSQAVIVRASALARLGRQAGPGALLAAQSHVTDQDPSIRYAALSIFEAFAPEDRAAVRPLLRDPLRAMRIQAAWLLASAAHGVDPPSFDRAAAEFLASHEFRADRPEDQLTTGLFLEQRGEAERAMAAYRAAVRLAPDFAPAHHTLALALVRAGLKNDALAELQLAADLSSDVDRARFTHDYAVALHSLGRANEAIATLERVLARAPADRDVLFALTTFHRDAGHLNEALKYANQLQQLYPSDPDAVALVRSLRPSQVP